DVFLGAIVSYSNEVKESELGVPAETLASVGAVSAETAAAMASGARERLRADVAVAITGIAGPDGGTPDKPVGLVYLHAETADASIAWQPSLGARGRLVPRDNLHFTLAFLGRQPESRVGEVAAALRRRSAATPPPVFQLERYRETRSVGMLVFSHDEGAER